MKKIGLKKACFMLLLLSFVVMTFQSCYTTLGRKSLTKQKWIAEHRYQYIESKNTKGWNEYYWRPSKSLLKKQRKATEIVEAEEQETPPPPPPPPVEPYRYRRTRPVDSCCLFSEFIELMIHIFFPGDNWDDNDNDWRDRDDDEEDNDKPHEAPRRRGS